MAPAAPAEITLFSPASDVLAMFSEGETSCISGQLGEATYQGMLGQPLAAAITAPGQLDMILNCLAPENAAELVIVGIGAVAGGFADESAACLRTLYTTTGVSNIPLGPSQDPQEALLALSFFLCLTDEEAQALSQTTGIPMQFPPSALRCVNEQIPLEQFLPVIAGDLSQAPQGSLQVIQACNINLTPG